MLLLQGVKQRSGRVALPVQRIQPIDQMLQQHIHIRFISNAQVHTSTGEPKADTLPGIERQLPQLLMRHRVDVFPEHPETRVRATEMEVLNIGNVATTLTLDCLKVLICFEEAVRLTVGKPLLTRVRDRLAVQDDDRVSILREL